MACMEESRPGWATPLSFDSTCRLLVCLTLSWRVVALFFFRTDPSTGCLSTHCKMNEDHSRKNPVIFEQFWQPVISRVCVFTILGQKTERRHVAARETKRMCGGTEPRVWCLK